MRYQGDVMVSSKVTMFKKIKLNTHENLGFGKVHLPELEMHTTSFWFGIPDDKFGEMNGEDIECALSGIANLLANITPVYLMCDPKDICVVPQIKSPYTDMATIHIYDNQPGGIGFSEKLFTFTNELLVNALDMLNTCECLDGCPYCVGVDNTSKLVTRYVLKNIIEGDIK